MEKTRKEEEEEKNGNILSTGITSVGARMLIRP
jgi:hypothetical protein